MYRRCRISPGSCKIKKRKRKKKKETRASCRVVIVVPVSFSITRVERNSDVYSWPELRESEVGLALFVLKKVSRKPFEEICATAILVLLMRYLRKRALETYEYVSNFYSVRIR